jgi:hypothetical protein
LSKKLSKSCQKVVKIVAPGKKTKILKRLGEEEEGGEGEGEEGDLYSSP